jgi:hypothetical protein
MHAVTHTAVCSRIGRKQADKMHFLLKYQVALALVASASATSGGCCVGEVAVTYTTGNRASHTCSCVADDDNCFADRTCVRESACEPQVTCKKSGAAFECVAEHGIYLIASSRCAEDAMSLNTVLGVCAVSAFLPSEAD